MLIVVEVEKGIHIRRKQDALVDEILKSRLIIPHQTKFGMSMNTVFIGDVVVRFIPSCESAKKCRGIRPDYHCSVLRATGKYLTEYGSKYIPEPDIIKVITKHFMEEHE